MSAPITNSYFAGIYDVSRCLLVDLIRSGRIQDCTLWGECADGDPYVVVWMRVCPDTGLLDSGYNSTWGDYSSLDGALACVSESCAMDSDFLSVYHYEIWHVVPDQRNSDYDSVQSKLWLVGVTPAFDIAPANLVSDLYRGEFLFEPFEAAACCVCDFGCLAWVLVECKCETSRYRLHNDLLYYLYHACGCHDGFVSISEEDSLNREIVSLPVDGDFSSGVGVMRTNNRRTTRVVTSDDVFRYRSVIREVV